MLLCTVQLVFAYAICDAAKLDVLRNGHLAYMPPLDVALFYLGTVVGETDYGVATDIPIINVLCSLCSIYLLTRILKTDTHGTAASPCPFFMLLLPEGESAPRPKRVSFDRSGRVRVTHLRPEQQAKGMGEASRIFIVSNSAELLGPGFFSGGVERAAYGTDDVGDA